MCRKWGKYEVKKSRENVSVQSHYYIAQNFGRGLVVGSVPVKIKLQVMLLTYEGLRKLSVQKAYYI
jgi:hypothetical protein